MRKLTTVTLSTALAGGMVLTLAPTSSAATSIRSKALSTATAQKGDPYKGGAAGPNAFDCSGLTYYSYRKNGKTLPRTAQGQYNKSSKVSWSKRAKGDLVFFGTSSKNIKHVGIYVGNNKILNANSGSYRGYKVVVAPISEYKYNGRKVYIGRVKG
ncbi:hydrolase [Streptomyces phage JustBecause]|jgi:cell wall-associated NlpC family hydrolase|nr:hydrolase [Streptomyces phage JustBecause]